MIDLRPIPGHPAYSAGADGFIYRAVKDRRSPSYPLKKLAGTVSDYGYIRVAMPEGMKGVHILVATAFHGPKPGWANQVRHLNGNKRDNRPRNLEWGTYGDNEADKRRHGTTNTGTRNGRAILNEETVRELRSLREGGAAYKALAQRYGISISNARAVVERISWGHV